MKALGWLTLFLVPQTQYPLKKRHQPIRKMGTTSDIDEPLLSPVFPAGDQAGIDTRLHQIKRRIWFFY